MTHPNGVIRSGLWILALSLIGATAVAQQGRPDVSTTAKPKGLYRVDASYTTKRIAPLNGVNAGPGHLLPDSSGAAPASVAAQYQEMGIPEVRMHDFYGPGDLSVIFGTDWSQDPYASSNYDYTETDAVIDEIRSAGCQAMFRFGQSNSNAAELDYVHPDDHQTVAQVCGRIALHYGGSQSDTVKRWEVWNEPDLGWKLDDPSDGRFWDTQRDRGFRHFFGLYAAVARQLKKVDNKLVVGGPGAAGHSDDDVADFAKRFAIACKRLDAPLDFYSWHYYNRHREGPYVYARQAERIRAVLDGQGFNKTPLILSEWNSANIRDNLPTSEWGKSLHDMNGAAFNAAALVYLHLSDANVQHAFRYRGDYHTGPTGYGLIKYQNGLPRIKKPGYAIKAYAQLFPMEAKAIRRLEATGGNLKNDALLATTDGARHVVTVLISQWKSANDSKLTVYKLPRNWRKCLVTHARVSESHNWKIVQHSPRTVKRGAVEVVLDKPDGESVVHVVRFTNQTGQAIPATLPGAGKKFVKPPPSRKPVVRPPAPPRRPPVFKKPPGKKPPGKKPPVKKPPVKKPPGKRPPGKKPPVD